MCPAKTQINLHIHAVGSVFAEPSLTAHPLWASLVGSLVVLGLTAFEAVFKSISGRLPKRGRKREKGQTRRTPRH